MLKSDRQGFQFKASKPNFESTLSVSMQLQDKIRQAQAHTYGDVFFTKYWHLGYKIWSQSQLS